MSASQQKHLDNLRDRVEQILGYHTVTRQSVKNNQEILAHFTRWPACEDMFKTASATGLSLWASDATCLNDPLEGRELLRFAEARADKKAKGYDTLHTFRDAKGNWNRTLPQPDLDDLHAEMDQPYLTPDQWGALKDKLDMLYQPARASIGGRADPGVIPAKRVHLVSFCRDADRLDLWRAYSNDGDGVCMVMPLDKAVTKLSSKSWKFYRVAYDEARKTRAWALLFDPLSEAVSSLGNSPDLDALEKIKGTISKVLYLFKHPAFSTEREIRLVYEGRRLPEVADAGKNKRAVVVTPPFFLGSKGSKLMLGPKTQDRNIRAAVLSAWAKKKLQRNPPEVLISEVPYQ